MSLSSKDARIHIALRYIRIVLRYIMEFVDIRLHLKGTKMVRNLKVVNAKEQPSWQETAAMDAGNDIGPAAREAIPMHGRRPPSTVDARFGTQNASPILKSVSAVPLPMPAELSVRAENVLKELAVELTDETPPKGRWIPPHRLLRKLTFRHLLTARNCGPQTTDEIVRWSESRGVVIQPPFHAGKPLSATWQDLIAKFSTGEFTKAEIAEALERSARRKNTRIPVAFQNILSKILNSAHE